MFKKISVIAFLLSILTLTVSNSLAAGGGNGYYYAMDTFAHKAYGQRGDGSSSYDTITLGGSISHGTLFDSSTKAPVAYRRKTNTMTGKIVWELAFTSPSLPAGTTINLKSDETDAILLKEKDGKLYVVTSKGNYPINDENSFYGIKAFVDIDNNTFSLYANGNLVVTNAPFVNKVDSLNYFYISTSDEGTGAIRLSNMYLHTDYLVNERFVATRSAVPGDWKLIGSGCRVTNENISQSEDTYGLRIEDSSYLRECGISHDFTYKADGLRAEYLFFTDGRVKDFGSTISANGESVIRIGINKLAYGYWVDGKFTKLYDLRPNLWYQARVCVIDGKAEVYINQRLLADNITVKKSRPDNIAITIGKVATGKVYVDAIDVKDYDRELPKDYPSPPVHPKQDPKYIIGVQSCSLWREGSQFGWDCLNPYKNRKPYLGYFDEGNPEVNDWETKWKVEHGIKFQMYCWFRSSSTDKPIQRPGSGWELHEGFLNSEYKKDLKFCLMWENLCGVGVSGYDDFVNNVAPYWLEYYFKNDSYLLIDNKPVISYIRASALVSNFGSKEKLKAGFDWLDNECKKAGFDGIFLMPQSEKSALPSKASMELFDYLGADALFNYSLGTHKTDDEMNLLKIQSDATDIPFVATPTMGVNNDAWGYNKVTGYPTVESYLETLTKVRDVHMASQKGVGATMLTLDNWNEYSEGHAFAPSNLTGFGYVDAIREVYTEEHGEHVDEMPSQASLDRIHHLYVQDRYRPLSLATKSWQRIEQSATEYVDLKRYDFDNDSLDAYPIDKQIDNYRIENGALCGDSTGNDPGFFIKDVNLPVAEVKQIVFRMKTSLKIAELQVFYKTTDNTYYAEGWSERVSLASDGEYVDVIVTPQNSIDKISGVITEIRVDPFSEEGDFAYDYVAFRGPDPDKTYSFKLDGNKIETVCELLPRNGDICVPIFEVAGTLDCNVSQTFDGKYLQLLYKESDKVISYEIGDTVFEADDDIYVPLKLLAKDLSYNYSINEKGTEVALSSGNEVVEEQVEDDPPGVFNFNGNSTQGLNFSNVTGLKVANGALSFSAITIDPMGIGPLGINAADYRYCTVRMRNRSLGNIFQIFFLTDTSPSWSENNSITCNISMGDDDYKIYTLDMASKAGWKGKVTNWRVDPSTGLGDIKIDYIIFSKEPLSADAVSGNSSGVSGVNILKGGTMDKQELTFQKVNLNASYSTAGKYIGKYALKLDASDNSGIIKFPLDINIANQYSITAMVNAMQAGEFEIGYYDNNGAMVEDSAIKTTINSGWNELALPLQDNVKTVGGIYIKPTKGVFYIDDLKVLEKKASN